MAKHTACMPASVGMRLACRFCGGLAYLFTRCCRGLFGPLLRDLKGPASLFICWAPNNITKPKEIKPYQLTDFLTISKRILPARAIFRVGSATESYWLQRMLVLTVHWWPAPVCVGGLLATCWMDFGIGIRVTLDYTLTSGMSLPLLYLETLGNIIMRSV